MTPDLTGAHHPNMQTALDRLDVATGVNELFTPDAVTLKDRNIWSGLKLEHWAGEGQEMAEAILPAHTVIINVGAPVSGEMHWSGHKGACALLASRHVAIVPAYLPYWAVSTSYSSSLVLALRPDYLSSIAQTWVKEKVELKPAYSIDDKFIVSIALALANDIRQGSPFGTMYGETLQASLAAHLLRWHAAGTLPKLSFEPGNKNRIREVLLDQLDQDLKLADLAREMKMDVSTFTRWFRKTYGVPPHQFILQERISRAKVLLRTTKEPLVNIALNCGFNSHSHFATVFKRIVGIQPGTYRLP